MIQLYDLAIKVGVAAEEKYKTIAIQNISLDSRLLRQGDIFVALSGKNYSADTFLSDAMSRGAVAVLSEHSLNTTLPNLVVPNLRTKLGWISSLIYGAPDLNLSIYGVTGTNGKTTTALLLRYLLQELSGPCAYLGTLGVISDAWTEEFERTTLEAPDLFRAFHKIKRAGIRSVAMECSSHGIVQSRLNAVNFNAVGFTNLTQDHLDFHSTMDAYGRAKLELFTRLLKESNKTDKVAVINLDDDTGRSWVKSKVIASKVITYSQSSTDADLTCSHIQGNAYGTEGKIHYGGLERVFRTQLIGDFNISNILAAFGMLLSMGYSLESLTQTLPGFAGAQGRMQSFQHSGGFTLVIDYAHTPDALSNVLRTIKKLSPRRLITVFGCGGDRDRSKRPRMAHEASLYSDYIFITSDNPRTEDPKRILDDIHDGILSEFPSENLHTEVDRRKAIAGALKMATKGDIVLIAGKGHETYQEINGVKHPFDDRTVAQEVMDGWLQSKT